MKRIKSFEVDHNTLQIGMYISRVDDDIVTYDLRMVKPNGGVYLDSAGMHTVEHLMATFLRNSEFEKILFISDRWDAVPVSIFCSGG